ncbi:MAG: hypothetical protein IT228_03200 [Flavobacteriales bacterium]|nr:hypothetical protein [Flavobacteriales bacterium]MCC6576328.1 hypothetical protein [Flavobacteriales bacterium]NUQ16267.1 hypothetical protein [Flavobacteriales bacterium]
MPSVLRSPVLLLGAAALLAGCHKPYGTDGPQGHVRLKVEATWQGQPVITGAIHQNVNNYRTQVDLLRLYLAELRLTGPGGAAALADITFFDALDGGTDTVLAVEAGTYSGLHLGLGVPAALNASDPVLYPVGHPLSVSNGTYWTWATGYRFVLFDGRYDTDPNGTGTPANMFSFETGMDPCYRVDDLVLPAPLTVQGGDTTDLVLRLEVDRFFHNALDTIDLATDNQTHGDNLPLAMRFTDNVLGSITVQ